MNHRLCRKLMYGMILLGISVAGMPLLISELRFFQMGLLVSGALLSMCGIILGLIFLRCLYCQRLLNLRGFSPDYCPHCGEPLD